MLPIHPHATTTHQIAPLYIETATTHQAKSRLRPKHIMAATTALCISAGLYLNKSCPNPNHITITHASYNQSVAMMGLHQKTTAPPKHHYNTYQTDKAAQTDRSNEIMKLSLNMCQAYVAVCDILTSWYYESGPGVR